MHLATVSARPAMLGEMPAAMPGSSLRQQTGVAYPDTA
jgi:hypothetical protein